MFSGFSHFYEKRMTSSQIIIATFVIGILTGTLLLMLPFATAEWGGASFVDALFTATSAMCVTGLVVHDTAMYWSLFGKLVILLLIQVGGMGVVTMAVAIAMMGHHKIDLLQRSTMQAAISAPNVGGIVRLTGFIVSMAAAIEIVGAIALSFVFVPEFGFFRGIGYSIFHSISAFCNAGFDLMGVKAEYSSLVSYSGSALVNIVVVALIVVGGIGFTTWDDLRQNTHHFHRYRLQTKVILTVTATLIVVPALYFFFCEYQGLAFWQRLWESLFQSATSRTAGFNTADLGTLTDTGKGMMIALMLIGGSPGSTAGGMKTTTILVLLLTAIAVFRQKDETECFDRRIGESVIKTAATILMMYGALFFGAALLISYWENIPLLTCLFETASAIGTVGLTLGITPHLGTASHLVLIGLMFFGRVGGLTLIFAAVNPHPAKVSRLPEEKITVG